MYSPFLFCTVLLSELINTFGGGFRRGISIKTYHKTEHTQLYINCIYHCHGGKLKETVATPKGSSWEFRGTPRGWGLGRCRGLEKIRSDEIEDKQATYKSDKFSGHYDVDPMDVLDLSMDGSGSSPPQKKQETDACTCKTKCLSKKFCNCYKKKTYCNEDCHPENNLCKNLNN